MVKVSLRAQRRMIEDHDTDFYIRAGETIEIADRFLKANSIKALLFCGDLIVEEGEVEMNYKVAKVKISADDKEKAYIQEKDKQFVKNLVTGEMKEVKEEEAKENA